MKTRHILLQTSLWWAGLCLFFLLTNPSSLPVPLLVVPFVLTGVVIYQLWQLLPYAYARKRSGDERRRIAGVVISSIVVICLGLESIGELAPRDFITVSLFGALAYFYAVRNVIKR